MKPLQAIAMGLIIVLIHPVHVRDLDPLPDPIGWLLALYGVTHLPRPVLQSTGLNYLCVLALLASVPLWIPAVAVKLDHADLSLQWAVGLPQAGFAVVLAWMLADAARMHDDLAAFRTWRTVATFAIVVALLPTVVFGGGVDGLAGVAAIFAPLTITAVVVLCFTHAARPWALASEPVK